MTLTFLFLKLGGISSLFAFVVFIIARQETVCKNFLIFFEKIFSLPLLLFPCVKIGFIKSPASDLNHTTAEHESATSGNSTSILQFHAPRLRILIPISYGIYARHHGWHRYALLHGESIVYPDHSSGFRKERPVLAHPHFLPRRDKE